MEFNALRVFTSKNYNYFFVGQIISRMGTWMQRTAVLWVVYMLTNSVFMVGVATFAEQFPSFVLSPWGGIVADKYDRNKVVIVTQIVSALQALLLTLVYANGWHNIWLILCLSLFLGIANAFDIPARQAMVNELVPSNDMLPSAIAMNSSLNNFARLAGPALAGIVLAKYGATVCFASNFFSFLAVIYCLFKIKIEHVDNRTGRQNGWINFKNGISYVKAKPEIGTTLLLSALLSLLVATYNTLQPYFAHTVFHGDAATYGYINGATGIGALVSTLFIASQRNDGNLKRLLFFNLLVLGIGLCVMSFVRSFPLYLIISMFCGFGTMSTIPIANTIIQTSSSKEMRGRVVGFFAMATLGTLPLGSLIIGWLAKIISPQTCQLSQGVVCLIIGCSFIPFLLHKNQINNLQNI